MKKTIYLDTEFSEGFYKPISWLPGWLPFNKPRWNIELISIGLVDNSGKEYYAINKNFRRNRCNDWVKKKVLTKLPSRYLMEEINYYPRDINGDMDGSMWPSDVVLNPVYKSLETIKHDIKEFCIPYNEVSDYAGLDGLDYGYDRWIADNELVFKAYFADYDWVLFCTIFGTMMDLPKGFPMYCVDLKQEMDRKIDHLWWIINQVNGDNKLIYGPQNSTYYINKAVASKEEMVKTLKSNSDYPTQFDEHNALDDAKWNKELDAYIFKL